MLHRLAVVTAGATLLLIMAGGIVTSTGAGLAVPDWPTTFGYNLFLFPWSRMVGAVLIEHAHRLLGAGVGILTVALAIATWAGRREPAAGEGPILGSPHERVPVALQELIERHGAAGGERGAGQRLPHVRPVRPANRAEMVSDRSHHHDHEDDPGFREAHVVHGATERE